LFDQSESINPPGDTSTFPSRGEKLGIPHGGMIAIRNTPKCGEYATS
jgi:hypothetical protein